MNKSNNLIIIKHHKLKIKKKFYYHKVKESYNIKMLEKYYLSLNQKLKRKLRH